MWLAVGLSAVYVVGTKDPKAGQSVLTVALGVFFLLLLARLGLAAVAQRGRRSALVMLFCGVLLWATGSAVLNGSGQPDLTVFPAPGEWFFLAAYLAVAGYLIADALRRADGNGSTWLEAAIVCGGSACLAGSLLLTPVAHTVGKDGLGLLLALLYPLIDIVLALVVVGQVTLRYRESLRQATGLLLGLSLFTAADLSFIASSSAGTYEWSLVNIVMWGTGFALIVDNACRRRVPVSAVSRGPQRGLTVIVLLGSMAATAVLAFDPWGPIREYLLLPALATLAAAGARMVLAVRAANRAAEAFALSLSDDLTSLPNRRAVQRRLDEALATDAPISLMIMDLDGFKDINDTLGHSAGDAVLRSVADRARAAVPDDVMLARLGGDEFAVLCRTEDEIELSEIAQLILASVREPLKIDGIGLSADASIGMTVRQELDLHSTDLLRRADIAMYDAKRARAGAVLYNPDSDQFSRERLALGDDLRRAIAEHQLELWYQPQFDAVTRQVRCVEALVRWQHPTRGLLSPAVFLPIARRVGLMLALSEEIGRIAVADMVRWRAQGIDTPVAINCAPPELMSGIFLPRLGEMLNAAGIHPSRVTIEVTEESFLAEPERARAMLLDLRELGFEVSVDDYGTGFSSLSYLRDLPIQELKMDRSFVAALRTDVRSRMIVVSTFHLADALGLRMVAEGVEDAATAADLVSLGVHVLQGYHLARPLPPAEIIAYLRHPHLVRFAGDPVAG